MWRPPALRSWPTSHIGRKGLLLVVDLEVTTLGVRRNDETLSKNAVRLMALANEEMVQQKLPGTARFLGTVLVTLGALPVLAKMVGYQFLPSADWVATTTIPGIFGGVAFAAGMLWLTCKSKYRIRGSEIKKAAALLGWPFIGYFFGNNTVVFAGPMILAIIAGHQVELPYTVVDPGRYGTSECRSPVELRDVPFLFNSLCRVPDELRRGLEPGGRIIVIGRGTSLGLYVEGLRRAD
jgi:hypothetical protein